MLYPPAGVRGVVSHVLEVPFVAQNVVALRRPGFANPVAGQRARRGSTAIAEASSKPRPRLVIDGAPLPKDYLAMLGQRHPGATTPQRIIRVSRRLVVGRALPTPPALRLADPRGQAQRPAPHTR